MRTGSGSRRNGRGLFLLGLAVGGAIDFFSPQELALVAVKVSLVASGGLQVNGGWWGVGGE